MSDISVMTEDRSSTSTVGLRPVLWPRMPAVMPWCGSWRSTQLAGTSGVVWVIAEPSACLATAPTINVRADWNVFPLLPFTAPVEYGHRSSVKALVGNNGMAILNKLTRVISDVSRERGWPLVSIEVTQVEDTEVENWRYVLVTPVFSSRFEDADGYLRAMYDDVDSLAETFDGDGQDILRRKVFFDVRTTL